jgi:hypothetical protein
LKRRATHSKWLAVSVSAAFLLSGCGGSGHGDALGTVTAAAHSSLSQVPIVRPVLSNPRAFGDSPAEVSGLGAFIFQSGIGFERIDLPGKLDANGKPPRDFIDIRADEIDLYPAVQSVLPPGRRWISLPLSSVSGGQAARFVEQAEAVAPMLWLEEIVWGGVSARSRGGVVIKHVPFSTYDIAVDLHRTVSAAKSHGDLGVRIAAEQQLASLGGRHIVHVSMWRDGQGRVARLEGVVAGTQFGKIRLDLFGYGVKVTPNRPKAAELVPFASLVTSKAWSAQSPWVFSAGAAG